jgi:arylsulfatase A-like enzyme
MIKYVLVLLLALLPLASLQQAAAAQANRKPNIVYIMADDLGWTDVACYGSKYYETPNIDRLAAEGMRFTSGYTTGPNCQPTRAALLSGQYEPRTGVYTVGNIDRFNWQTRPLKPVDNVTALPLEKITIAQAMKNAGYATGMFGKWHLGPLNNEYHPSKRGFDEAIESSGKHFDFDTHPKTEYPQGQYLADFLTDKAVDFITRHKAEPFFLYLPHFGVHGPYQAKPELIERFKKKPGVGGHNDPTYAAMLYSVDESVGRVMKTLEDLKLADNTLVVFTSDNGGVGGYASVGIKRQKDGVTDNAPLKGGKGTLYEGGVRVPFIFRLPGKIPAGATSEEPIISVDIYPTLLQLAQSKPPKDYPLDGVSLVPLLTEKKPLGRDAIYWHFPGYLGQGENQWRTTPVGAIRSGDWKLLEFFEDGKLELYNLKDDLSQANNLAEANPEKARELHAKLKAWRDQVGAKMPTKNDEVAAAGDAAAAANKKRGAGRRKQQRKGESNEE